jgi:hypothetical protein
MRVKIVLESICSPEVQKAGKRADGKRVDRAWTQKVEATLPEILGIDIAILTSRLTDWW